MAEEHDVMLRLLRLRDTLAGELRDAGGELRVGLFTARAANDDAAGRAREVRQGLARSPWIREVIPFDDRALAVLDSATLQTAADRADARTLGPHESPRIPLLHSKTQLIARPGAIAALVRQPGWDAEIARGMRVQSAQTTRARIAAMPPLRSITSSTSAPRARARAPSACAATASTS